MNLELQDRNHENIFLTLAAASCTSIAVVLAFSRTAPVLMFTMGLVVFCLILAVGCRAAGAKELLSSYAWPMATTWLWLSLFGWFAYISTSFWLWLISAAVIAAWLTRKQQLQPSIKGNL
jgi:hypothetical protein